MGGRDLREGTSPIALKDGLLNSGHLVGRHAPCDQVRGRRGDAEFTMLI